jgi:hypothetical protein
MGKKYKSLTPPFLLTFEIFNHNVHNCLVDSYTSSNMISYFVCKNLNDTPMKCSTHIIQFDRLEVKVIGELKYVLIRVVSDHKIHQVIDIFMVDIPKSYGIFLSQRQW